MFSTKFCLVVLLNSIFSTFAHKTFGLMQVKTRGIVIGSLKYSDSSVIVTVYTQQFGRISYMIYGATKKKSAFRSSFLQPLTLVDIDAWHLPGKEIQRIKDVRVTIPLIGIPFHPVKNAIALFISELLQKALHLSEPDDTLYSFLENAIQILDYSEYGLANFHLIFMIKLARYLGFEPTINVQSTKYFDLLNGVFCEFRPAHIHYMSETEANAFYQLAQCNFDDMGNVMLSRDVRFKLIEDLEQYYRLHISDFRGLNSLPILHELFS